MKERDLAQTIGVLANVGVLAGIVFLGIEINQNTAMIEADMNQSRAEIAVGLAASMFNSEFMPEIFVAIAAGQTLTDVQAVRYGDWLRGFHRIQDNVLRQYREGLLGEEALRSVRGAVRNNVAASRDARDHWEQAYFAYSDAYVELVDDAINTLLLSEERD